MATIDVIIPVYNAQNYLERCLDSLLCQTFQDWSALLIDDGSLDRSGEICDCYANRDKRFGVVHKANGGVSSARNEGLALVTGEFVTFVDSDDCVANNYFEKLLEAQKTYDADYVHSHIPFGDSKKPGVSIVNDENIHTNPVFYTVWGNLYRVDIIKDMRFDQSLASGEDTLFSVQAYLKSQKVVAISDVLYHYDTTTGGVTSQKVRTKQLTMLDTYKKISVLCCGREPLLRFIDEWYIGQLGKMLRTLWNEFKSEGKTEETKAIEKLLIQEIRNHADMLYKASWRRIAKLRFGVILCTGHLYYYIHYWKISTILKRYLKLHDF